MLRQLLRENLKWMGNKTCISSKRDPAKCVRGAAINGGTPWQSLWKADGMNSGSIRRLDLDIQLVGSISIKQSIQSTFRCLLCMNQVLQKLCR